MPLTTAADDSQTNSTTSPTKPTELTETPGATARRPPSVADPGEEGIERFAADG